MRKILILLALSVLIQTTVSQDFRIGEEDLFRPEIYAKYIKNVTLVRCSECRGPGIGDLDVFDVGEISCLMSARDECVNSSHVLEYYCVNTSSVDSQSSECPVNYSCSGGKCMYLPASSKIIEFLNTTSVAPPTGRGSTIAVNGSHPQ